MELRQSQEVGLQIALRDKLPEKLLLSLPTPRRRSRGRLRSTMILDRRRPRLRCRQLQISALWLRDSIPVNYQNIRAMLPPANGHRVAQNFPALQSTCAE